MTEGLSAARSCHFEVVDLDNRTVGDVRFHTAADARDLLAALLDMPGVGPMAVAKIVERVVIERRVTRIVPAVG